MTRIVTFALIIAVATGTAVIAADSPCDLLKADLSAKRADIINEVIPFTEEQAEIFWPLYEKFSEDLADNLGRQTNLLNQLADNYDSLEAKLASGITESLLDTYERTLQLQREFHKQLRTELPTALVARLMQLEVQLDWIANLQTASQLPQLTPGPDKRGSKR